MILRIAANQWDWRKMDVSWLSAFREESERILVHGEVSQTIEAVILTKTLKNYGKFIQLIHLFQKCARGEEMEDFSVRRNSRNLNYTGVIGQNNKVKTAARYANKYENDSNAKMFAAMTGKDSSIDNYVKDTFNAVISSLSKLIINFERIDEYPSCIKRFILKSGEIKGVKRESFKIFVGEDDWMSNYKHSKITFEDYKKLYEDRDSYKIHRRNYQEINQYGNQANLASTDFISLFPNVSVVEIVSTKWDGGADYRFSLRRFISDMYFMEKRNKIKFEISAVLRTEKGKEGSDKRVRSWLYDEYSKICPSGQFRPKSLLPLHQDVNNVTVKIKVEETNIEIARHAKKTSLQKEFLEFEC